MESVLGQTIYAIEFAFGYTALERHLAGLLEWTPVTPAQELFRERLERAVGGLNEAMGQVRVFVEEADLGQLDRGLAGARSWVFAFDELAALARRLELPEWEERLRVEESPERPWQADWQGTVHRHQGETRATFVCKVCAWELTYVQEVSSADELEVPFSELACPICQPPLRDALTASCDELDDF